MDTQPIDLEERLKVLWRSLRQLRELTEIQAQEIELLRARIKRLEKQVQEMADTQDLNL